MTFSALEVKEKMEAKYGTEAARLASRLLMAQMLVGKAEQARPGGTFPTMLKLFVTDMLGESIHALADTAEGREALLKRAEACAEELAEAAMDLALERTKEDSDPQEILRRLLERVKTQGAA